ncbi:protein translocase subunit SecF [Patescibacteria group bacterium]|nr:protein translocase subunit SecF [Patescibacteria group bacterium]
MKIIQKTNFFIGLSVVVIITSIVLTLVFGLKLGIDFTGGSLLEIDFPENKPSSETIKEQISSLDVETSQIQAAGEHGYIIRMNNLSEAKHQEILLKLKENLGGVEELRFESIGPTIGKELRSKAIYATIAVLVSIVLYLAIAFRKVTKEVSSWKFGVCAILALIHDIAVLIAVFVILGLTYGVEINSLFVTALLTVLGFSVHDTIVLFDRVRFNLLKSAGSESFSNLVNRSVNQTVVRSINTSATTLLVLLALYLFGGASIQWFVFALMIGVVAGTYSSIFVASPILVFWQKHSKTK